jgi:hypothetical protein
MKYYVTIRKITGSRLIDVIEIFFSSNLPNPSSRTMPWGLLILYQKLVQEIEKMFLLSGARLARKADNFTSICEPTV